jgi:hypothetical protein
MYRTTRCPYCKTVLETMQITSWNDYGNNLGDPTGICWSCKRTYNTGRRYWSEMTKCQKYTVYIKLLITFIVNALYLTVLGSIIIGVLGLLIPQLNQFLDSIDFVTGLVFLYFLIFPFSTYLSYLRFKQEIYKNF